MGGRGGPLFQNLEGQSGLCQHPVDIRVWDGMLFQQVFEDGAIPQDDVRQLRREAAFQKNSFSFPKIVDKRSAFL